MYNSWILALWLVGTIVHGASNGHGIRGAIRQSLESLLEAEAQGIENCPNKCQKSFSNMAYQISATDGRRTFEFIACIQGCNQCAHDLANNASTGNCFETCKNFNWKTNGIVKGVIEPDKACLAGCVINTCQFICSDGTVDPKSPSNANLFYPNGGCSIKTEPYSQFFQYVPFNSPNIGQGATAAVTSCCAQTMSLCLYVGDKSSSNFAQLLANSGRVCKQFVPSGTEADLCAFFGNPQNCGSIV